MDRTNIYSTDEFEGGRTLVGWFDRDTADSFEEGQRWDGNNWVSLHVGDKFSHQKLYRTRGGRWVLCNWSQWQGSETTYEYITDDQARDWLLIADNDDAIKKHFGEIEEERGPGRPEIGEAINVRLGDDRLARVDAEAKRRGKSRAATIRELIDVALS